MYNVDALASCGVPLIPPGGGGGSETDLPLIFSQSGGMWHSDNPV
jgi:hypothetical protein